MFTSLNKNLSEALSALCSKRARESASVRMFTSLNKKFSHYIKTDDIYVRNCKIIMQPCLKVELK